MVGPDIEPAWLVIARLNNELARLGSARLVLQTSQDTSSARLAKEIEPARLAREPNHKNTFQGYFRA